MQVHSSVQTKSQAQTIPSQAIPSHVIERMESEWRQMRQSPAAPGTPSRSSK